ncbi:MAG: glycosyl transferase [Cytophagaceae bacterium]|nr:MAG: glycosyl transferase [Cytophagaceae bacterium]
MRTRDFKSASASKQVRPASGEFVHDVRQLPVQDYDLVLNDFEPVSAWACRLRHRPCVALSHQSAVLHPAAPRPRRPDPAGRAVLRHYAPSTAQYGFHFQAYAPGISTPVIRQQVRALVPTNEGHYTVYLPAFDEQMLVHRLRQISRTVRWEVFSKHSCQPAAHGNVRVWPVSGAAFLDSLARAHGVLCGAGFETPAEALYLGKKLLVVPMKQQYEQQCNAAALATLGVPVVRGLKQKHRDAIADWLRHGEVVPVDYPDQTGAVLDLLLAEQLGQ